MKGLYFVNSDIENKRAHVFQMLSTVEAIRPFLDLTLIFPWYGRKKYDLTKLFSVYGLKKEVPVIFQSAWGIKEACLKAFLAFDISAAGFLLKQRRRTQVDFIYFRSSLFFVLAIAAYWLGIPFFYEIHRKPLSWSERFRDSFLAKRAAGLIVISEVLKQHYLKYNKNILVVHDAVSLERFGQDIDKDLARQKLGLAAGALLGVYSGAIRKIKGVDVLIDAAKNLPWVNFEAIGPIDSEFKSAVIANFHLAGPKKQAEVPVFLAAADFLLLPHPENEYSQSPMKLFEYLAAGRPIISSDLPNIKEVLPLDGNLLFKPGNSEILANTIKKYLENRPFYDQAARQNKEVAKEYTWKKRGEKIANFIKQSLKKIN
ncbi:MAG: glycosyltransferase [Candidatus Portnoybacteria bacterium]|nr:glycosyltransferase [Candidatus Portnoybacteria bacterium]MDD4982493.1 glycosyltransferase [Candidatus Portnoybacteria bacterium]